MIWYDVCYEFWFSSFILERKVTRLLQLADLANYLFLKCLICVRPRNFVDYYNWQNIFPAGNWSSGGVGGEPHLFQRSPRLIGQSELPDWSELEYCMSRAKLSGATFSPLSKHSLFIFLSDLTYTWETLWDFYSANPQLPETPKRSITSKGAFEKHLALWRSALLLPTFHGTVTH